MNEPGLGNEFPVIYISYQDVVRKDPPSGRSNTEKKSLESKRRPPVTVMTHWNESATCWAEAHGVHLKKDLEVRGVTPSTNLFQRISLQFGSARKTHDFFALPTSSARMAALVPFSSEELPLLASLSHDLTNPLHATYSYLDTFLDYYALDTVRAKEGTLLIIRAQRACARALEMVKNYRVIEKLVSWEHRGPAEPTDLGKRLTHSLAGIHRPRDKAAHVVTNIPSDGSLRAAIPRAFADQIISNLLSNCFKFTPADGTISVTASRRDAKTIQLRFWNTGPTIPPNELERITERFVRASSTKGISGSGLGLFIVSELTRRAGGEITISTSKEESLPTDNVHHETLGTLVCVTLPAARPEDDADHT